MALLLSPHREAMVRQLIKLQDDIVEGDARILGQSRGMLWVVHFPVEDKPNECGNSQRRRRWMEW